MNETKWKNNWKNNLSVNENVLGKMTFYGLTINNDKGKGKTITKLN